MSVEELEEGGAVTGQMGLRLLTIDRGPKGYGFHMYTNNTLKVSSLLTVKFLHNVIVDRVSM